MHFLDRDQTLILRTARKSYRCCQGGGRPGHPAPDCTLTIQPRDRYVEYVGEVPLYQSGSAYCLPCHVKHWGEIAPLPEGVKTRS